jgi:ribosomal protection tetracycline resistance protein
LTRRKLNLGILAHVDAGKTTLTERLLYAAGVLDAVGSVDHGTTQTDSLALERERGITIRASVVSFEVHGVAVNLIDTPGHPDFIAEVERALGVLDGAILVVSAVEGVQPQTRILMRALRRLSVPTVFFVNKIDRRGADPDAVVASVRQRLAPGVVPLGHVQDAGTRAARFEPARPSDAVFVAQLAATLADHDDDLLAAVLRERHAVPYRRLRRALAAQTRRMVAHPLLFGSALTGAGVDALAREAVELLPAAAGDPEGDPSGTIFKIERDAAGGRVAYVRMHTGRLRTRDRVHLGETRQGRVTGIEVFERGPARRRGSVAAGEIAKVRGLREVRIGDAIGTGRPVEGGVSYRFAPPTLETVVEPADPAERGRLRVALAQLAEQDPLIDVRQDDTRREIAVSLYGEVQQEVLEDTLRRDYGIAVTFQALTPRYVERPAGTGEALEVLHAPSNPHNATMGLRIEPAPPGSGVEVRIAVDPRTIPLYVFKTLAGFGDHLRDYVLAGLREGLAGWEVVDCVVTLVRCGYSVADGPPSRRGPRSTSTDFRDLTPLVLRQALADAGTDVCEPVVEVRVEAPDSALPALAGALGAAGAETSPLAGGFSLVRSVLPVTAAHDLKRRLPELTSGEGVVEWSFAGYQPVRGARPTRPDARHRDARQVRTIG